MKMNEWGLVIDKENMDGSMLPAWARFITTALLTIIPSWLGIAPGAHRSTKLRKFLLLPPLNFLLILPIIPLLHPGRLVIQLQLTYITIS